jgi:hypothetical protein
MHANQDGKECWNKKDTILLCVQVSNQKLITSILVYDMWKKVLLNFHGIFLKN